jgi:hypothetical protein
LTAGIVGARPGELYVVARANAVCAWTDLVDAFTEHMHPVKHKLTAREASGTIARAGFSLKHENLCRACGNNPDGGNCCDQFSAQLRSKKWRVTGLAIERKTPDDL